MSIEPPKLGGGCREKGSSDMHHKSVIMDSGDFSHQHGLHVSLGGRPVPCAAQQFLHTSHKTW